MVSYYNDVLSDSKLNHSGKKTSGKLKKISPCTSTKFSRVCGKNLTYQEFFLFVTFTIILISWCTPETSALPAPSSPWNQAGLNLIFKTDLHEKNQSKGKNSLATKDDKEKGDSSDKVHTSGHTIPSHSWGYTRYGHGQGIGHFRHAANRRHFIPNNKSVPCPRDYIRLYNGKCRKIPSFTSSRVG